MNFLGLGPAELVIIAILLLVVGGPRRMVEWAYQAGRLVAQLRAMYQETMTVIQREFEDAGLNLEPDVRDVKKLRKVNIASEARKVLDKNVTGAIKADLTPVASDLNTLKADLNQKTVTPTAKAKPAKPEPAPELTESAPERYDAWQPKDDQTA